MSYPPFPERVVTGSTVYNLRVEGGREVYQIEAPTPSDPIWIPCRDVNRDGRVYYWNKVTNERVWVLPPVSRSPVVQTPTPTAPLSPLMKVTDTSVTSVSKMEEQQQQVSSSVSVALDLDSSITNNKSGFKERLANLKSRKEKMETEKVVTERLSSIPLEQPPVVEVASQPNEVSQPPPHQIQTQSTSIEKAKETPNINIEPTTVTATNSAPKPTPAPTTPTTITTITTTPITNKENFVDVKPIETSKVLQSPSMPTGLMPSPAQSPTASSSSRPNLLMKAATVNLSKPEERKSSPESNTVAQSVPSLVPISEVTAVLTTEKEFSLEDYVCDAVTLAHAPHGLSLGKGHVLHKGKIHNGSLSGKADVHTPTGEVVVAQFHQNKVTSPGSITFATGDVLAWKWIDTQHPGTGTVTIKYQNGDVYDGDIAQFKKHGKGVFRFKQGHTYHGEYQWGMMHGHGTFHFENGNVYVGEFVNNKFEGKGKYQVGGDAISSVYEGLWKEGMMHGDGVMKYSNGDVWTGKWKNDKRWQGKYTFSKQFLL